MPARQGISVRDTLDLVLEKCCKVRHSVTKPNSYKQFQNYSGYQSHTPFNNFFSFQKLSFGGRQSNVSMTIVVFISCQFQGHVRSSLDQA